MQGEITHRAACIADFAPPPHLAESQECFSCFLTYNSLSVDY